MEIFVFLGIEKEHAREPALFFYLFPSTFSLGTYDLSCLLLQILTIEGAMCSCFQALDLASSVAICRL